MTTTTRDSDLPRTPTGHRSLHAREAGARRRWVTDRIASGVLLAGMLLACIPLLLIVWQVAVRGAGVLSLEFFTQPEPPWRREGGGYAAGFFGTAYIMGLAILMSVPLGIAAAVYLTEYRRTFVSNLIQFVTDVMTGVPSIFVGLFVYALLVVGWGQLRFGTFVGAVAISIMMLPIVVRSSEEMLKLVPQDIRAASAALGARKWQTITRTVLPAAGPGLVTGSMLAVARGAGETAPLLLTALGSQILVTAFQGQAQGALTLQIYRGANQPFAPGIARAWGGALCLLAVVLVLTVLARWIGVRAVSRGGR
jgi:phosphate transport system permease protein